MPDGLVDQTMHPCATPAPGYKASQTDRTHSSSLTARSTKCWIVSGQMCDETDSAAAACKRNTRLELTASEHQTHLTCSQLEGSGSSMACKRCRRIPSKGVENGQQHLKDGNSGGYEGSVKGAKISVHRIYTTLHALKTSGDHMGIAVSQCKA